MDIKERIGKRIRFIRESRGLSQKDLAYSADLDRSYIASVENGCRNISIVNIEKITRAMQVTLSDFFTCDEFNQLS